METVSGECCRMCCRPFSQMDEQFRHGDLCNDCVRWEADSEWQGYLDQNVSLFQYNNFLKEVIARFKFRGDYVIAKAFAEQIKSELAKLEYDFLVPIPLSEERLYERGFNQAEALLTIAGYTPTPLLTRIHSEKQSKKSRNERIHVRQVFQVSESVSGKILLIDDIYTTGSTLRHAAKILKEAGAERIQSITLAR
ncbi:ComF family protein [Neobacillus sp. PS3-12]|uniref:ComF family protein n=1 Tax=Neobacillus sp. PS3-12 TaxID=3070677 RepID=UPI0035A8FA15